jgi:hypothetical protein
MNTHVKSKLFLAIAGMLPLLFVVPRAVGSGQQEPPTTHPYIIFVGTVDAINAVALQSLKASPNTSVVVVEKVVKKPEAIALVRGDRVTVLIEGSSNPLKKGTRALFVTDGWIYGESLAVKVVSWEPTSNVASAATASDETKATAKVQELAERDLRESINSVDIAVVGRVKGIQAPSASELIPQRRRISEHEPDWQEAIVEVQEILKGSPGVTEVVVRFPASVDVMWVGYPKFKAGQEGTFLLRQDQISGASKAILEGKSVTAYTAITRKDVLNKADSQIIKRLMQPGP